MRFSFFFSLLRQLWSLLFVLRKVPIYSAMFRQREMSCWWSKPVNFWGECADVRSREKTSFLGNLRMHCRRRLLHGSHLNCVLFEDNTTLHLLPLKSVLRTVLLMVLIFCYGFFRVWDKSTWNILFPFWYLFLWLYSSQADTHCSSKTPWHIGRTWRLLYCDKISSVRLVKEIFLCGWTGYWVFISCPSAICLAIKESLRKLTINFLLLVAKPLMNVFFERQRVEGFLVAKSHEEVLFFFGGFQDPFKDFLCFNLMYLACLALVFAFFFFQFPF